MKFALFPLLAFVVAFAVFSPLLRAPFLFDDHTVIEGDGAIVEAVMREDGDERAVDLWKDLWRKPRPLRQLSHRVEWRIVGDSPALPHATNILLHLAVAAAGWWLLRRRCGVSPGLATLAALLFLVNPVVVESVGIVSHRKEMLSALFLLLSLAVALKAPNRFSWVAAACLLLAAAGKETALVAPALFALMAFRVSNADSSTETTGRRAWLRPFALYCVVAAIGAAFFWWQIHAGMDFAGGNPGEVEARAGHFTAGVAWGEAISAALRALPRNLLLLALPFGHAPDPAIALHVPLFSAETAAAAVVVCIGAVLVAMLVRRGDPAVRPALWIVFALAPYLYPGLLRMGATAVLADRYLYLASFGFAWLLADVILRLPRRVSVAASALVLAVYAVASFRLCGPYRDEAEYWGFAVRENPSSVLAAHNHAWGLWKEHEDFAGAKKEFRRMLSLAPDFDYGVCSFAQMNAEENDPDSAFDLLESALHRRPNSMLLHRQRALTGVLFDEDDTLTLAYFRKAARLGAKDSAFHLGYAELLQRMLEWPAAAHEFELVGRDPAFAEEAQDAWFLLHNPMVALGARDAIVIGDSVPHGTGTAEGEGASDLRSLAAALEALLPPGDGRKAMDASVPGSTVEDVLGQLDPHLESEDETRPSLAICVIHSGHNDAFAGASSYEILQMLADAALECRKAGIVPVIVGPISVRDEPGRRRSRQEKVLAALDRKLASFCKTAGIYFVSARAVLGENDPAAPSGANYDAHSGNHLSREGIERLSRVVLPFVFPPR